MLIINNLLEFLSEKQFKFHFEDQFELQFVFNCNKGSIKRIIEDAFDKSNINFNVSIDNDQSISIPNNIDIIEQVIEFVPDKEVELKFKFKKSDLLNDSEFTNTIIYYEQKTLEAYLKSFNFDEFNTFIFNDKQYSQLLIINGEEFKPLINNYISINKLSDVSLNEYNKPFSKENSIYDHSNYNITPEHLYFDSRSTSMILEVFNKWCSFLALDYLSSHTENVDDNDTYLCHFNGQKKIMLKTTFNLMESHDIKYLYDFYTWVDSDKTEDKLKIFHNLLPLHINLESPIDLDRFLLSLPELVDATKENFNFYIKDNIKVYLEERKKIEDLVMNTSNLISGEINRITDLLVRTFTGVFISVISAIIIVLIRSQLQSIASYGLYFFSFIIFISLIIITYFSYESVQISYRNFDDRMDEYSQLFSNKRITKLKQPINDRKILFLRMTIITNIILFISAVIIFSMGMYLQNGSNILIDYLIDLINHFTVPKKH